MEKNEIVTRERIKEIESTINYCIVKTKAYNSVIFRNLSLFYALSNILCDKLPSEEEINFDITEITKKSVFENIDLIKSFYKRHDISFDFDTVVSDGTLDFYYYYLATSYSIGTGRNYYGNGKKLIDSCNNGLLTDSVVLLHELSHLRNQLETGRNEINDLLTEALSYTEELIFLDYLSDLGYTSDVENFKNYIYKGIVSYAFDSFSLFKMINLYEILGDLSIDSYKMLYNDDDYNQNIFKLDNLIRKKDFNIFKRAIYIIGFALSTYMYYEFKKDSCFMNNIQLLHEKTNTSSIYECLKLMNLKDLSCEDFDKIEQALENMNKDLKEINNLKEKKKVI